MQRCLFPIVFCALEFFSIVGTQQAFGSVSYSAIQKIIPHATDANVFALAQGLNQNIGNFPVMRNLVNKFFNQNKAGKPNPKTLSLYDNSTYSKQKLIALVNNRQAVTQWWTQDLIPGITKFFDKPTAILHRDLYAYFDSRYANDFLYTLTYWYLTVLMKVADLPDDEYYAFADIIDNSLDARMNKSDAIAFQVYTRAFEANHNQTLQKGKW